MDMKSILKSEKDKWNETFLIRKWHLLIFLIAVESMVMGLCMIVSYLVGVEGLFISAISLLVFGLFLLFVFSWKYIDLNKDFKKKSSLENIL